MAIAESAGNLHEEQWGSRKMHTSTNVVLKKIITYKYGRYMKAAIGLFANDQTTCFGRMWTEVTNLIAVASGADANTLNCRVVAMENMVRHVKTDLGVSKASYSEPESCLVIYQNKPAATHPWSHSKDPDTASPHNTAITEPTLLNGARNKNEQTV